MDKKRSKNFESFQKCIRQQVKNWNKTTLTDLEKYCIERYIIWGIFDVALYILPLDDYQDLKQWMYDEYGFDIGGVTRREY